MERPSEPLLDDAGGAENQFAALRQLGVGDDELEALRRQGHLTRDQRRAGAAGYWRLRFRFGRRTRTAYVGTDAVRVEQVRQELAALRGARLNRRRLLDATEQSKRAVRDAKQRLAPVVASLGYHFHGDVLRKSRRRAATTSNQTQPHAQIQTQPLTAPRLEMQTQPQPEMQTEIDLQLPPERHTQPEMHPQFETPPQREMQIEIDPQLQIERQTQLQMHPQFETRPIETNVRSEMQPKRPTHFQIPTEMRMPADAPAETETKIQEKVMQDCELPQTAELKDGPPAGPQDPLAPPDGHDPAFRRQLQSIEEYREAAGPRPDQQLVPLRGVSSHLFEIELYLAEVLIKRLRSGPNSAETWEDCRLPIDGWLRLTKQIGQYMRLEQAIVKTEPRDARQAPR